MGALFDTVFRRYASRVREAGGRSVWAEDGLRSLRKPAQLPQRLQHRLAPHADAADVAVALFRVREFAAARGGGGKSKVFGAVAARKTRSGRPTGLIQINSRPSQIRDILPSA